MIICSFSDCTEFFVQSTPNYKQQGNIFSSYKHHTTIKVLIGVTPQGHPSFVSDAFEGSISDYEITKQSGFIDHLMDGDFVCMDRGFIIGKKSQKCITKCWIFFSEVAPKGTNSSE